jgi:photosystem II stability/assembly factor-like uncharacterized protein
VCFQISAVFAHSPHDVIDLLELSPAYSQDKTVFIYSLGKLLKSNNGGYSWKELVNGLRKGYDASAIAISTTYHLDKTLFSSSRGGGIYQSLNGGLSWQLLKNNLSNIGINELAISPSYSEDKTLFAADHQGNLYKTVNGGDSFYKVYNGEEITSIQFAYGSKNKFIFIGDAKGGLHTSKDSGNTWERLIQISNGGNITSIAVSSNFGIDKTIFIGTAKSGLYKSVDGGSTFQKISAGLPETSIISVVISPGYKTDSKVFVSTWFGVFGSKNWGETWKEYDEGLTTDAQADKDRFNSPHFRDLRISETFENDQTLFVAGFDGLFKSEDGAQSWMQLETFPVSTIQSVAISPTYNEDATIVLTTFFGGVYTSNDRGESWHVHNLGLHEAHLMDVAFSPNFPLDHSIFTVDNVRFYESTDAGQHWHTTNKINYCSLGRRIQKKICTTFARLGLPEVVFCEHPDKLCKSDLFPWVISISPNFKTDRIVFFGTRYEGIFRSDNGGQDFSPTPRIGQNGWITSLSISPNFISDKTLFTGVRYDGIYKTIDSGYTWRNVHALNSRNIYVEVSPSYKTDRTVFAGTTDGLIKTTDGGKHWEKIPNPFCGETCSIVALAVSPNYQKDKTVFMSVRGSGLFKSENGGKDIVEIGKELINQNQLIRVLELSPAYETDQTVFAASKEEVFRSNDMGKTWKKLKIPARYEESVDYIQYTGKWESIKNDRFSTMKTIQSDNPDSRTKFIFVGSGIRWIGGKGKEYGIANVYIDGRLKQTINQFSSKKEYMVPVFSLDHLTEGPHTVEIEVTDTKHSQSTGYTIDIDAFDVIR